MTTAIAAGARVHLAEELVERLPATLAALQRGEIDLPKARAVVDAVAPLGAQTAAAVEARVLARAAAQTVGQLRAALARAVLTVDPDGVEQRHRAARAERRVELGPERDGMAWLGALLPAHEAIACYTRLDTLARSMPDDDPRGMDARRADAMVDLLLGPDDGSGAAPVSTELHLTMDPATLVGLADHPGELAGYGPVPASLARELAAAARRWRALLVDPRPTALLIPASRDSGALRTWTRFTAPWSA